MSTFNLVENFSQLNLERGIKRIGVIFVLLSGGGIGIKLATNSEVLNQQLNKNRAPVELFLSPEQLLALTGPNSPIVAVGSSNFVDKLPPTEVPVEATVVVTPSPEPTTTSTQTDTPAETQTPEPTKTELQNKNPLLITADYIDQNPQYFPKDTKGNIIIDYKGTQVLVSPQALRAMKGLDGQPILFGPYLTQYPNIDVPPNDFRQDTAQANVEPLAGFLVTILHPRGTEAILAVPKKDGFFFVTCESDSMKESFWVLDQKGHALPGQPLLSSEGPYHFDSHTITFPHEKTLQPGEPFLVWYINNPKLEGGLVKWIQTHSDNRTPQEAITEETGNIELAIWGLVAAQ